MDDLRKAALDDDASAEHAVSALVDIDTEAAWNVIETVAQTAKFGDARKAAVSSLLTKGDRRGIDNISRAANAEEAAWMAHFAIGTDLETDALKAVLEHARKPVTLARGARPQYFGSLLARLTRLESHQAVASASINQMYETEKGWWLISCNRASTDARAATRWLRDDKPDTILNGLRYLQRVPEPLAGDDLKLITDALAPLIKHENDDVLGHALLTAIATGACRDEAIAAAEAWLKDDKPLRRATALIALGRAGHKPAAARAIELLKDEAWYVQSAALDCLLHLRAVECAGAVFEYVKAQPVGRLFSEGIALLVDLTGQDFGDELNKWEQWLKDNPGFSAAERKLESLRGVPHRRMKDMTGARFYGLEINSLNVQFALDRSVSMINPVSREPERVDFVDRKADILKRRPEVNRMVRDGFLPRFYVAAAEMSAALDGMPQNAMFGITLFNHEFIERERLENSILLRRGSVNWMLSTDIQGGTDIKNALLAIIERTEADTILLLSDGEPMSLSILEMIARANEFRRVNIMVVSIHDNLYDRHYLSALAARHYGKLVDAEPRD
jgi:HEAT repeat protein